MSVYCTTAKSSGKNEEATVFSIEISRISPNPNQPRKVFSEESIIKLADSIRQYGVIQPLVVRKTGENYELVSGERRLRASKELGLDTVPCIITDVNEQKSAEMSIIENLIREDLNIFEQAHAIEALIDTYGLTQEQIAKKLSNSQSFIANKLRLLRLNDDMRAKILENNLTERHARALLRIWDEEIREKVLEQIISEGLNVEKSEELIDKALSKDEDKKQSKKAVIAYKDVKSFYVAIDRAIDTMKNSGVKVKSRRIENDNFTELTILIPKNSDFADQSTTETA